MTTTPEFQGTSEQPIIDVIGVTTDTEQIGFQFENILHYRLFNFSFIKWVYKNRHIHLSLPIFKRNSIMLIKGRYRALIGIKGTLKEYLRNTVDALHIIESVTEKFLLKKIIPKKLANVYIITSPFISQGISLLPFVFIYVATSDRQFYRIHCYGCLRTFYLVKFPFRLLCSNLMPFSLPLCIEMALFFPKWFTNIMWRTGPMTFVRRVTLSFAIIAEIFGEPFPPKRLLPNKPLTYKVAQPCNTGLLKHLQKKQQQNLLMFEVMRGDNLGSTIELEIIDDVPRIAECVIESTLRAERLNDINQLEVEKKKLLGNKKIKDLRITQRKQLRIRSQIKAKKWRDAIKRVLFF